MVPTLDPPMRAKFSDYSGGFVRSCKSLFSILTHVYRQTDLNTPAHKNLKNLFFTLYSDKRS